MYTTTLAIEITPLRMQQYVYIMCLCLCMLGSVVTGQDTIIIHKLSSSGIVAEVHVYMYTD